MNFVFITGMSRSGTTLLDKCISSLPESKIISQPFPFLYRKAKKSFFQKIEYPDTRYVLNNYFYENRYKLEDFYSFLAEWRPSNQVILDALNEMKGWSGQTTKVAPDYLNIPTKSLSFPIILEQFLQQLTHKNLSLAGYKEIHCEEFVESFTQIGWKAILVIRNPLDVVCSIQYGKGENFVGVRRPTLFHVRNWRKSAHFGILFEKNKNILTIRFEDLVMKSNEILANIADFLEVDFPKNKITELTDTSGARWVPNSSFDTEPNNSNDIFVQDAVGRYTKIMDVELQNYVSYLCSPEMQYFGYPVIHSDTVDISKFEEPFNISSTDFPQNYSATDKNNIELERLKIIADDTISECQLEGVFIDSKVITSLKSQKSPFANQAL